MVSARLVVLALLGLSIAGAGSRAPNEATRPAVASGAPGANAASACTPTDQDRYVYRPARLQTITACVRATGTVVALSKETDGDVHIRLRLDAPYEGLLTAGNAAEGGSLVVEPICHVLPPQADAMRICASDPDPYAEPLPEVGAHVWMEGRYVVELQHAGWGELHPLYRWGAVDEPEQVR